MTVTKSLNFGFVRYVEVEILYVPNTKRKMLVIQWPWDGIRTAMLKRRHINL